MGISTVRSYSGAQVFEAVGLDRELVERHFTGTASRIGGVGLDVLAREALDRHARATASRPRAAAARRPVPVAARRRAAHVGPGDDRPAQHSVAPGGGRSPGNSNGNGDSGARRRPTSSSPTWSTRRTRATDAPRPAALRGDVEPIPLDEVEPAAEIVKRFSTGGMSLGALSPEAHETLAVAMNRLGGHVEHRRGRRGPAPLPDERRSAIKQVASGRFGVTIDYLVNADQLQIKVAQGAKPGEGGQLPGHKVDAYIARLRHSTPGVELISPPPHHDIYSIEDLKQLIYDLRCANPRARSR